MSMDRYASEYGWVMNPPPGWEPLPQPQGPVLAAHFPAVFSCEDDSGLSLTWMIAGHPMKEEVAKKFLSVTQSKQVQVADLMEIAPTIFPVIGNVDLCEIVDLADGTRAIEVIETYRDDGEEKNGYQMILPLRDVSNYPLMFQRLCFYAPAAKFEKNLANIRAAGRTFHYVRPYGYRSEEDTQPSV